MEGGLESLFSNNGSAIASDAGASALTGLPACVAEQVRKDDVEEIDWCVGSRYGYNECPPDQEINFVPGPAVIDNDFVYLPSSSGSPPNYEGVWWTNIEGCNTILSFGETNEKSAGISVGKLVPGEEYYVSLRGGDRNMAYHRPMKESCYKSLFVWDLIGIFSSINSTYFEYSYDFKVPGSCTRFRSDGCLVEYGCKSVFLAHQIILFGFLINYCCPNDWFFSPTAMFASPGLAQIPVRGIIAALFTNSSLVYKFKSRRPHCSSISEELCNSEELCKFQNLES